MTQENESNTLPIGATIAGNEPVLPNLGAVSGKNRQEQIKFLSNSIGNGQNRANRRAFAAHIRKNMKGLKIDG